MNKKIENELEEVIRQRIANMRESDGQGEDQYISNDAVVIKELCEALNGCKKVDTELLEVKNKQKREIKSIVSEDTLKVAQASNLKKERRLKFGTELICGLLPLVGYVVIQIVGMAYENEGNAFTYTAVKNNLNKIKPSKK